jgi:cell division protein FtsQ
MVYPVQYHTRVLTDRNLSLESLQYMMIVLDVIDKLEENVKEVDLRYGSVSYKTVL